MLANRQQSQLLGDEQMVGGWYEQPVRKSRVVSIQNLPQDVLEADLLDMLSRFGHVSYTRITGLDSALLEFEEQSSAESCINFTRSGDFVLHNRRLFVSYADIQSIPRTGLESEKPTNVLIAYIMNAKYPITTNAIHQICEPLAPVCRVIITRDIGIQAMIEFPTVEMARLVKQRLNGCDIYSGCCTLKIEFSKVSRLMVTENNQDQADYGISSDFANGVNPVLERAEHDRGVYGKSYDRSSDMNFGHNSSAFPANRDYYTENYDKPRVPPAIRPYAEYPPTPFSEAPQVYRDREGQYPDMRGRFDRYRDDGAPYTGGRGAYADEGRYGEPSFDMDAGQKFSSAHPYEMARYDKPQPCVLMLYGLKSAGLNCDYLFNLLCLYGNVNKVKFLKNKSDTCMVEMADQRAASRVMEYLQNAEIMDGRLHVVPSRQVQLNEVRDPPKMNDGSSSFKDYTGHRFLRFTTADIAAKNRVVKPQRYLYFFNAPPDVTEEVLGDVFSKNKAPKPVKIKIFSKKESVRHSAGIIDFENEADATTALMLCNHVSMECKAKRNPFILKLCFAGPASTSVTSVVGMEMRGGRPRGSVPHRVGSVGNKRTYNDDFNSVYRAPKRGRSRSGRPR